MVSVDHCSLLITNEVFINLKEDSGKDVTAKINIIDQSSPAWSSKTGKERAEILKKYGFEYRIQDYKKSLMKITIDFNDEIDSSQ